MHVFKVKRRGGPARIYTEQITKLLDDRLYTPRMVAEQLSRQDGESDTEYKTRKTRMASAMSNFVRNNMPDDGDGRVGSYRAFWGRTWKKYYLE